MILRNARDQQFFNLLRSGADNVLATARMVGELCAEPARHEELVPRIKELESQGDHLTHDLFELINRTYVTPIDSEDLAALARALDSAVDGMEAAAARAGIYRVMETDECLQGFAKVLQAMAAELVAAVEMLGHKRYSEVHKRVVQLHVLENEGDDVLRAGLSALYEKAHEDPVRFITMKEIYESLEDATDQAKSVGTILDGVVMKHS